MGKFNCSCSSYRHQNKVLIQKADSKAGKKKTKEAKKVMKIADRLEPLVIADLLNGIAIFKKRIDIKVVEEMLEGGEISETVEVIPWDNMPTDLDGLPINQTVAIERSAKQAIATLKPPKDLLRFDIKNPRISRIIDENIGQLVVQITDDGRAAIRQMAVRSLNQGLTPNRAAKLIQESVGLTENQSIRIMNRHAKLLSEREGLQGKLADLQRRNLSGSKTAINTRVRLTQLTDDRIDQELLRRSAAEQRNRVRMIARTELTRTVNEGQLQVWDQAVEEGILDPTMEKVWVTINDVDRSSICDDLDGQRRKLNETFFVAQTGESVQSPPAHPNCRSTLVLEDALDDTRTAEPRTSDIERQKEESKERQTQVIQKREAQERRLRDLRLRNEETARNIEKIKERTRAKRDELALLQTSQGRKDKFKSADKRVESLGNRFDRNPTKKNEEALAGAIKNRDSLKIENIKSELAATRAKLRNLDKPPAPKRPSQEKRLQDLKRKNERIAREAEKINREVEQIKARTQAKLDELARLQKSPKRKDEFKAADKRVESLGDRFDRNPTKKNEEALANAIRNRDDLKIENIKAELAAAKAKLRNLDKQS